MNEKTTSIILSIFFFIIGGLIIYSSIDNIIAYYETGKISFQLKSSLPRFYGNEALMMNIVNVFVGLVFLIAGFTYLKKKQTKEHNKY